MKMLIMGAPGSGKGTQAGILSEKLGIPAISTGAMLRAAIFDKTDIGNIAVKYINDGRLVPDDVMISLALERIGRDDCAEGYILDGFPRTVAQAEAMTKAGINVDAALVIEVEDSVIMERLSGRRVCDNCGETYHIIYKPPAKEGHCDVCGFPLSVREDDKPETIKSRLSVYYETTLPVIEYYRELGQLVTVKGETGVENTTVSVMKALEKLND